MSELKSCCSLNCENPNALEYQKCWKSKHNTACCACCQGEENEEENTTTVVKSTYTRGDFIK